MGGHPIPDSVRGRLERFAHAALDHGVAAVLVAKDLATDATRKLAPLAVGGLIAGAVAVNVAPHVSDLTDGVLKNGRHAAGATAQRTDDVTREWKRRVETAFPGALVLPVEFAAMDRSGALTQSGAVVDAAREAARAMGGDLAPRQARELQLALSERGGFATAAAGVVVSMPDGERLGCVAMPLGNEHHGHDFGRLLAGAPDEKLSFRTSPERFDEAMRSHAIGHEMMHCVDMIHGLVPGAEGASGLDALRTTMQSEILADTAAALVGLRGPDDASVLADIADARLLSPAVIAKHLSDPIVKGAVAFADLVTFGETRILDHHTIVGNDVAARLMADPELAAEVRSLDLRQTVALAHLVQERYGIAGGRSLDGFTSYEQADAVYSKLSRVAARRSGAGLADLPDLLREAGAPEVLAKRYEAAVAALGKGERTDGRPGSNLAEGLPKDELKGLIKDARAFEKEFDAGAGKTQREALTEALTHGAMALRFASSRSGDREMTKLMRGIASAVLDKKDAREFNRTLGDMEKLRRQNERMQRDLERAAKKARKEDRGVLMYCSDRCREVGRNERPRTPHIIWNDPR